MLRHEPIRRLLQALPMLLMAVLAACTPTGGPITDSATATVNSPSVTPTAAPPSPTPEAAASATPTVTEVAATENTILEVGGSEAVIFTAANAEEQGAELWFGFDAEDYWTPDEAEIIALEEGLEAFLREEAGDTYPRLSEELPSYKRQYFGIVNEGAREIFGVFFCASYYEYFDNWDKSLAAVNDGGDCFFELRYNVETGTLHGLSVHGEA
jgi:hypothetical protein